MKVTPADQAVEKKFKAILADQAVEKKLKVTPADQVVEKKLKVTPADQKSGKTLQSNNLIKTITGTSNSDVSPLANDGSPTSSKTLISMVTKQEDIVFILQDVFDDESHLAIITLGIPQPSHSVSPMNPNLPLVNKLTEKGFTRER